MAGWSDKLIHGGIQGRLVDHALLGYWRLHLCLTHEATCAPRDHFQAIKIGHQLQKKKKKPFNCQPAMIYDFHQYFATAIS